jgi:hypothetical protein
MARQTFRGDWVLPFSMFFGTFAWSFVFVSLPFYAWMSPGALYLVLAGMGLLVVPLLAGLSGPGAYPREARS